MTTQLELGDRRFGKALSDLRDLNEFYAAEAKAAPYAALARASDPGTSHQAAESIKPGVADLEAEVLAVLRAHPAGLTIHEIAAATGRNLVSVSPRMKPLVRKGLVLTCGDTRPSPSNRPCIVWRAA